MGGAVLFYKEVILVTIKLKSGKHKKVRMKNRVLEKFKIGGVEHRLEIWRDGVILTEWTGDAWEYVMGAKLGSDITNQQMITQRGRS